MMEQHRIIDYSGRIRKRQPIAQPGSTSVYILVVMILLLAPFQSAAVHAQGVGEPTVTITKVDAGQFPLVDVYVHGRNLSPSLAKASLTVLENDVPQTIIDDSYVAVGTQTALIFDASGNVRAPGMTGEPRYIEVGDAVRRLVRLKSLSPETDWLTSVAFDADGKTQILREWTRDHQAAVDALYIYEPSQSTKATPLFDQIYDTLEIFDAAQVPDNLQRSIIVFSDGIDVKSTLIMDDLQSLANEMGVRIDTVLLGPESGGNVKNLQRLSRLTGGSYYQLRDKNSLDPLWRSLGVLRKQRKLTYRTSNARPGEVAVESMVGGNVVARDAAPFPATTVLPPNVTIVQPDGVVSIERTAPSYDTPIDEMEPQALDVAIEISWPDGFTRSVKRVDYQIGDKTESRKEAPFDQISLSIASLDQGEYSLKVKAIDELGMVGEAETIPVQIAVNRPPAPTATPDQALIQQADEAKQQAAEAQQAAQTAQEQAKELEQRSQTLEERAKEAQALVKQLTWVTAGSGLLALIALGLAIYVLSSRERRRKATQVITGTAKAMTEPFRRAGRKGGSGASQAKLTLIDSGGSVNVPNEVRLYRGHVNFGRDPSIVNIVLDDRRVSRLHCRISEDPDGGHRIWDEGSTGGTYVNDQEVEHAGRHLEDGDTIEIGPILYRYDADGKSKQASSFSSERMYDQTEVFERRPDKPSS